MLSVSRPRFPNSTIADRIELYKNILEMQNAQAAAAVDGAAVLIGVTKQPLQIDQGDVFAVIGDALAATETITYDVTVKRPADVAPVSILAAPAVLTSASLPSTRIAPTLSAAFDGLLPAGTAIWVQRTGHANPSVSPQNVIAVQPFPSA